MLLLAPACCSDTFRAQESTEQHTTRFFACLGPTVKLKCRAS